MCAKSVKWGHWKRRQLGLETCRWNLAGRSGSDYCYTAPVSPTLVCRRENLFKPSLPSSLFGTLSPSRSHQLSLHLDWMKSVTTSLVSWPAVSLISHLAWHTRTAVQQRAHYASPLTLPRACSFKYKVSKAGWFCNTYLIFASLRVQSFARLTVYEGVITPTVAAEVIWNANSPDNPLPPLWTTLTAYC